IVADARDASGRPVQGARLSVDGELRQARVDGTSITVDPGERTFRVEAGTLVAAKRLALRGGGEDRVIVARSPGPAPAASERPSERTGIPTSAFVLWGVGAVALASFGFFAASGFVMQTDMRHNCSPYCPESRMTALRQKYLAADISLGIAAL